MYTKHHTRGIVIGRHDAGEADCVYAMLTPDLGKVYARAHGVRNGHGRNKGALQTLSVAHVSLVRGKTGWRITNAQAEHSLYTKLATDRAKLATLTRVIKLVKRMLAGEGHAQGVFHAVESCADALAIEKLAIGELRALELLTVARILHMLGYVKDDARLEPFFRDASDVSEEIRVAFGAHEKLALTVVNDALSASQL